MTKFWNNKNFLDLETDLMLGRNSGFSYCPFAGAEIQLVGKKLDVVTLASVNIPRAEMTAERIGSFLEPFESLFKNKSLCRVCVGMFQMDDENVSVDINVIVHQAFRANTVEFARINNQFAIWDCLRSCTVETGGDGNSVLKTPAELKSAAESLVNGLPVAALVDKQAVLPCRWRKAVEPMESPYQYVDSAGKVLGECDNCSTATAFGDAWYKVNGESGRRRSLRECRNYIESVVAK